MSMDQNNHRRESAVSESDGDDEGELETLVAQHETKRPSSTNSTTAVLEIGPAAGGALRRDRVGICSGKRFILLAVGLPLIIVLIFFSLRGAHGVSIFRGVPDLSTSAAASAAAAITERMLEAELKAIYLLKSQQLGLLKLWNLTDHTVAAASPPSPAESSVPQSSELLRSSLFEQIKLNQEIQKLLFSSHRFRAGNETRDALDSSFGFDDVTLGSGLCRKEGRRTSRTVEWKPKKDRFLFAICVSGQMSNHLICLEKHMFFAALLDRVLVIPSPKVDYQYDRVLDINHINSCFGRKVVVLFDEFEELRKRKLRIDQFICYWSSPPCFLDDEHLKRLKNLGISLGKIETAWPEDAKLKEPKERFVRDIVPKFSSDAEVIAIGDMFYAKVEEEWVMQPGGPLSHQCKTLIQPSRLIMLTAQRFVQTFLGNNYVSLHFRRHGFLKFCNAKKESCFFPVPQAAECILRVVDRVNAPVIYLSTDAADSETRLLQSLVVSNGKAIPLVKRPEHTSAEKWDALLYRNHLGGDPQVDAMLDKTISALANVFIGTSGSTFTEDILRLRRGWGSASRCDEYLCQGELPNFMAEQD